MSYIKRARQLALVCLLVALGIAHLGCQRPVRVSSVEFLAGRTMGTSYSIKLVPDEGTADLVDVSEQVEAELESVNAQMSTYITTSELSRFNAHESADWFPVSQQTAEVVQLSLLLSQQTEGAFDVTVGPLVQLWGFGTARREARVPSQAALSEALESVGADKVAVRLTPPALKKNHPRVHVDLSAIAKGHGVDRVAGVLERLNFKAYFVEIGGEVRTRGRKRDGSAWQVGIERPEADQRSVERVLPLSDQSLATSGNYRNYFELEAKRYSHTINPRTGWPVEDSIVSASVVADSCALADGIATGMMSAGFEAGLAMAEKHGWSVMLMRATPSGVFEIAESTQFSKMFSSTPQTATP
jgi:thiamine biosynthesis lipoprotein